MVQYVSFCADYEAKSAKETNAAEDGEEAEATNDVVLKFRDCLKVLIGDVKKDYDAGAGYSYTDMNNNNNQAGDFNKDIVLDANVTKFDWTRDDDETVTLDENTCVLFSTKKSEKSFVKKGCTFRFAVVRSFDTGPTESDYWYTQDDLTPGENPKLELSMTGVSVRVSSTMPDNEVDTKATSLMLGPEDMQIMGFEHAYEKNLRAYVDGIIADLKDEVSTTYATLDTIFLGY